METFFFILGVILFFGTFMYLHLPFGLVLFGLFCMLISYGMYLERNEE